MTRWLQGLVLLFVAVLLSACAGFSVRPSAPRMAAFELQAKFTLIISGRATAGRLHWTRKENNDQIIIFPLIGGNPLARITGDPVEGYRLWVDGRTVYRHFSLKGLVAGVTGHQMPFSAMLYWLQGRAHPDMALKSVQQSEQNLQKFWQNGWTVHYRVWMKENRLGTVYPKRLVFSSDQGVVLRMSLQKLEVFQSN